MQTKFVVGSKFSNYMMGGGSYYKVRNKSKFCLGAECEIFLVITYFCSSYITEEDLNVD